MLTKLRCRIVGGPYSIFKMTESRPIQTQTSIIDQLSVLTLFQSSCVVTGQGTKWNKTCTVCQQDEIKQYLIDNSPPGETKWELGPFRQTETSICISTVCTVYTFSIWPEPAHMRVKMFDFFCWV